MALADRGGSSGYVGSCWGSACQDWLASHLGAEIQVNEEIAGTLVSVLDVDGIPGLASFASHRSLQNPDFMIGIARSDGEVLTVPVDAKFSVETAKPKQVSIEMATALIEESGSPVAARLETRGELCNGFFLSPDYELTHQVLAGSIGILRVAVKRHQVLLLPAPARSILGRDDVRDLALALAEIDRSRRESETSLLTALYYVRLAFSCSGAHGDVTRPLLGQVHSDESALVATLGALPDRARDAYSAWTVAQQWDFEAEEIRAIRIQVHQAADLPISNKDARSVVEATAKRAGIEPPSLNRVRRELARWSNTQMVARFGTIYEPVENLEGLIGDLRNYARDLAVEVPERIREIVLASG